MVGWKGVDWNFVAQDRDKLRGLAETAMIFRLSQNEWNLLTCLGTSNFSRSTLPHGVRYETSDVREGEEFYWNFSQWRSWRFECCGLRLHLDWYILTREYLGYSTGCGSGNTWRLVCDNKGPQVYDVTERVAAVDYTPYIHTICCLASPERQRMSYNFSISRNTFNMRETAV